jgi:probable phosphoglycerate mutase
VRHGETEWSRIGRHTGRTDVPLTVAGREQAIATGEQLAGRRFALILCSPLLRARETCELAGFGDGALVTDDLREWDYGKYEGLTTSQILAVDRDWNLWRDGCPGGGELPEQVGARADRVLALLREADGDAIAFAHGHLLRAVAARWLGMEVAAGGRFALATGAIGVLGYEREVEVLTRWNVGG